MLAGILGFLQIADGVRESGAGITTCLKPRFLKGNSAKDCLRAHRFENPGNCWNVLRVVVEAACSF